MISLSALSMVTFVTGLTVSTVMVYKQRRRLITDDELDGYWLHIPQRIQLQYKEIVLMAITGWSRSMLSH